MTALDLLARWPVPAAAGAVIAADGSATTAGDVHRVFELASVTKLLTAMAVLIAHEEGTLDLDEEVFATATVADLLAHSGGVAPDARREMTAPHRRRVYSTAAYEILGDLVADRAAMPFADYVHEAVCAPLSMHDTALIASPGAGARSTVHDLIRLVKAWRRPVLVHESTRTRATHAHRGELNGVLPGFGPRLPNTWGLGPEIRGAKDPHWTGTRNSPATYGHFGQAGTMMWIDPDAELAVIALTDRAFGPWATTEWPIFSDEAITTHR